MKIDMRGLEAFLWVAELGTFGRAAAHLNISQTAVSHRLKKLEESLGLQLFSRSTRQVTLTPAGADLLPTGRALISDFEAQLEQIRKRHVDTAEELTLACVPTLAIHVLPPVFAKFSSKRPTARVRLFDKSITEIGDTIASGLAEFGITLLAANHWKLATEPLLKDEFVCVCPAKHPLANKAVVTWSDLEPLPLVRFTPHTANRIVIDNALGSRADRFNWFYEVQHTMTAQMLVDSGLALAILPSLATQNLPPSLKALRLTHPRVTRTIGIVRRRDEAPSDLARVFHAALKEQVERIRK
ncbi:MULTISPECIES: LysR family transcriptional regulator [unclassified Beijerinckia]|uniref:LysR family transcriptional regulator n=1 Tax=unclassified Beijerinckia TaxID=2638183 RepID=UPI00089D0BA5|nr:MULTISPECIES: LysR family transcriptional regulator [unclassified Beijerinckia]MDH7795140.1 DNA-binding transcriptional LysR family regulator [Beijerinckia sp. GAS462]SEB89246.1 DNA-binding transcriptional regulator, LysR family [Beijerinckia sp. 28-YEA-48]